VPVKRTTPELTAPATSDLAMTSASPVSGPLAWTAPIALAVPSGSQMSAVRVYRSGMATIVSHMSASATSNVRPGVLGHMTEIVLSAWSIVNGRQLKRNVFVMMTGGAPTARSILGCVAKSVITRVLERLIGSYVTAVTAQIQSIVKSASTTQRRTHMENVSVKTSGMEHQTAQSTRGNAT
jgi:hypothetical protein